MVTKCNLFYNFEFQNKTIIYLFRVRLNILMSGRHLYNFDKKSCNLMVLTDKILFIFKFVNEVYDHIL